MPWTLGHAEHCGGADVSRSSRVVPDAEQCISYGAPAFKVQGKTIAGFAAFKNHLSYLPHSGSVLSALGDELDRYEKSKGCVALRDRRTATEATREEARPTARLRQLELAPESAA